jgi:hypothetical protein
MNYLNLVTRIRQLARQLAVRLLRALLRPTVSQLLAFRAFHLDTLQTLD